MQAELFTDEDLLALAAPLPQSGKVERSSLESAYRCIDYRAFADSRERLFVIQGGERMDFLDAIRLGTIASGKTVRLFVCTAFLNRDGADAFCEMAARGFVESVEFLLGWNHLKSKEAATVSHLRRAFKTAGLTQPRIHFARHHSKFVIAADCKTGLPLWVIISSANINENRRAENYLISASPTTARAYLDFFRAHLYIRAEGSQQ